MKIFDAESDARNYRDVFLDFLFLEIPNFIQIFTLVFVLVIFANSAAAFTMLAAVILILFIFYFATKLSHYILDQFSNPASLFNLRGLDVEVAMSRRYSLWYVLATLFIAGNILSLLLVVAKLDPIMRDIESIERSLPLEGTGQGGQLIPRG